MLRRHSQRCADTDILASASAAVQRQASQTVCIQFYQQQQRQQCRLLFCHGLKNVNAKGMRDTTRLYRHIQRLVVSKFKTENQHSFRTGTTCNWRPQKDASVSGRPCHCLQLHVWLRLSADVRKACRHVSGCIHTSLVINYPLLL